MENERSSHKTMINAAGKLVFSSTRNLAEQHSLGDWRPPLKKNNLIYCYLLGQVRTHTFATVLRKSDRFLFERLRNLLKRTLKGVKIQNISEGITAPEPSSSTILRLLCSLFRKSVTIHPIDPMRLKISNIVLGIERTSHVLAAAKYFGQFESGRWYGLEIIRL